MAVTDCLLVGQALLVAYLVVATSYRVWAWYYYGIALVLFTAGTLVAIALVERLATVGPRLCVAVGVALHDRADPRAVPVRLQPTRAGDQDGRVPRQRAARRRRDRDGEQSRSRRLPRRPADVAARRPHGRRALAARDRGRHRQRPDDRGGRRVLRVVRVVDTGGSSTTGGVPGAHRATSRRRAQVRVTVCAGDTVFNVGAGHDQFTVFRFRPEVNR